MLKDVKIKWDSGLMTGDISVVNGDLESDSSIETAVLISLFTDRRASEDDPLLDDRNLDRRGWWGDLVSPEITDDQIGSKLWLLGREKTTTDVYNKAKQYIEEALDWLIEDEVATKIEVLVERQGTSGNDVLAFQVKIYKNEKRSEVLN